MKARNWTTWERYLPSAKVETRKGAAALCLKPWDQILSEEGVEERMAIKEPLWRPWEKYLPVDEDAMALSLSEERPEKVKV
ncbi:MAG: hypothetical protein JW999_04465 [Methanotrichaceae archaeon]|nr:hypothetical protein [Methanotrichaceae archaeon]